MAIYRALTCSYWKGNAVSLPSDDDVLRDLGAPSLGMLVKTARLHLFGRVVSKLPSTLISALCAAMPLKTSWLSVVSLDLKWLAGVSSRVRPDSSISEWASFVRASPKAFASMIRDASDQFGASFVPAKASRTILSSSGPWVCSHCSDAFGSFSALCSHSARKHWYKCEARRYVHTTHCPVCCLECHTRTRVVQHIAHSSPVCLANLQSRGSVLTDDEVLRLDQEEHCRVRTCQVRSQPAAAYRPRLPDLPVQRADGSWWHPGDSGHPLGANRRLLLHAPA